MHIIKQLFIITALIVSIPAFAQKSKPIETDNSQLVWMEWNEGYEKAVKTGKIVLVDAYTDWCGWCKKMDRDTYSQIEVIKKINEHFIPIKFNPEIEDRIYKIGTETFSGAQLYSILTQGNSTGFPTIYYIFPSKKRILLDAGYKNPTDFIAVLNHIVEEGKK